MTSAEQQRNKSLIIVNTFDFIWYGDIENQKKALFYLTTFAKFYGVPLKQKAKTKTPDLKDALNDFILNLKGYQITIINLYKTLSNA